MRIFKFDIVCNLLENQKRPEIKYLGMIIYTSGDLQNTLVAPNVQPPNVQHCPQCATFF